MARGDGRVKHGGMWLAQPVLDAVVEALRARESSTVHELAGDTGYSECYITVALRYLQSLGKTDRELGSHAEGHGRSPDVWWLTGGPLDAS